MYFDCPNRIQEILFFLLLDMNIIKYHSHKSKIYIILNLKYWSTLINTKHFLTL